MAGTRTGAVLQREAGDRRARGRRGTQHGHLGKELGFSEEQSEAGHLWQNGRKLQNIRDKAY